ncbi:6-phosphogluconolactonase [Cimex lectularius]|uniref:6-phosphogluconolactonase n=1 Tax=Cimex lectularius TaxID=79782 RepID=A0A8I6SDD3_CIMLE|nr:6-phosphogluconolactonase [Cimex lectularius]
MEIQSFDTSDEVVNALCKLVESYSNDSVRERGLFKIGLSGGSLVDYLSKGLPGISTEWDKWVVFFCDERVVPFQDADSTYGAYKKKLMGKVPLDEKNFVPINPNLTAEDAAKEYIDKLKKHFPDCKWPEFDLLLLGMGPDGHTCSLFPDHPLLKEDNVWVAPINDSPKPPPSRVTFTLPVLNNSRGCIFAITGEQKVEVFRKICKKAANFPAGLVLPTNGKVHWLMDKKP